MKKLLPNGSVVTLGGFERKVMIIGRLQRDKNNGNTFDYAGCLYPEGIQDTDRVILFNENQIDDLYFIGFQDRDELTYRLAVQRELEKREG